MTSLALLLRIFRNTEAGKAGCIKRSPSILRSTVAICKRCVTGTVFSLDLIELFRKSLRFTEPC